MISCPVRPRGSGQLGSAMPPKKKSGKGKEKKQRRKQEQAEVAAALAKVNTAYQMGDFMAKLPAFQKYNRNGLDLTVSFHRACDLDKSEMVWCFELFKTNMKALYIRGGWGWNDSNKRDELTHDSACFIMARDEATQDPVGFINFRFDLDEGQEVVYCYEVQLSPEVRRKGLGKFLVQILELIGHRANMRKVVLTVFKENSTSNNFFREKLRYTDDETSPLFCDPLNVEDYTYSILSKPLVRPAKPAKPVTPAAGERATGEQTSAHLRVDRQGEKDGTEEEQQQQCAQAEGVDLGKGGEKVKGAAITELLVEGICPSPS